MIKQVAVASPVSDFDIEFIKQGGARAVSEMLHKAQAQLYSIMETTLKNSMYGPLLSFVWTVGGLLFYSPRSWVARLTRQWTLPSRSRRPSAPIPTSPTHFALVILSIV
jgi:hypothetical protein